MSSTSYSSDTDLNLSQTPSSISKDDPTLYSYLLSLHNAIEILLQSSDAGDTELQAFVDKFRSVTEVAASYTALATDGMIMVDASEGAITITLPEIADYEGWEWKVKREDSVVANLVTIVGQGEEYIDGHEDGVDLYCLSSYTVKANESGWSII